jgi:hypothetical protein
VAFVAVAIGYWLLRLWAMGGFQSAFRIIRISDVIRVEIPVSAEFPRDGLNFHFTWDFRGISAVFPYRGHKCTAKFPLRKSRLIGKNFPFRGNSAEFPAGNRT